MMTNAHYAVADDEADSYRFLGTLAKVKATAEQTGGAFSVVEFEHPVGFATPPHVHGTSSEAYYVLTGRISGFCGDERWAAGPGDLVWMPSGTPHGYRVEGDDIVKTLVINVPGGFERFVAEVGTPIADDTDAPTDIHPVALDAGAARVDIQHVGPPPAPTDDRNL